MPIILNVLETMGARLKYPSLPPISCNLSIISIRIETPMLLTTFESSKSRRNFLQPLFYNVCTVTVHTNTFITILTSLLAICALTACAMTWTFTVFTDVFFFHADIYLMRRLRFDVLKLPNQLFGKAVLRYLLHH